MAEKFESIFRQRQVEKLYSLREDKYTTHVGHVLRNKIEKNVDTINIVNDKQLTCHNIDAPLLELNEHFFLDDLQKEVIIQSRMRSSDGSVVYYVQDEMVVTENTQRSLEECEEKILHCQKLKDKLENLEIEFDKYKKKYKYQHRFFNFTAM